VWDLSKRPVRSVPPGGRGSRPAPGQAGAGPPTRRPPPENGRQLRTPHLRRWLRHPRNMSKTLPAAVALLAVAVAHHVDGPHSEPLARAVHYFWYTLWWFGLGVFSSIGLGTGPCPPLRRARPAARAASHAAGRPTHPASAGCARRMTRGARAAGAHTGSLFLFPHICAVVRTAERRRALDFDHTQVCSLPRPRD